MAQELVLRSNSAFLRKESICVVTRRTFVGQQNGNAGRAPSSSGPQIALSRTSGGVPSWLSFLT